MVTVMSATLSTDLPDMTGIAHQKHIARVHITSFSFFACSGPQSQQKEPARVNGHEVRFFTPVRRSVRIERASLRYPVSLQDHDLCVASYNDLLLKEDEENSEEQEAGETSPPTDNTPLYVYRQNEALKDKVCIQLLCDEDV